MVWLLVFVAGGLTGVIGWGGFHWAIESTNSLSFCISCHEMESTVYAEYRETVHYRNPSGVRAVCADCHVPHEWGPKVIRKIQATNELYHSLMGTLDTREKFEAKRLEMAKRVWASMKATDSRECRNCHSYEAMHWKQQRQRSRKKMREAQEKGETCIDCHKFIAHKRPADYDDEDD